MSDPSTSAITPANSHGPSALAVNGPQQDGGWHIEGEEDGDWIIPRAHLFQDTATEREIFGRDFGPGDLINTLTKQRLASRRFVPLQGFKDFALIEDGKTVRVSRNRNDFNREDWDWDYRRANGLPLPPPVQQRLNFICLFEDEDFPVLLRFKSTSYQAGRQVNSFMKLHQGRMLYELDFRKENGDSGPYLVPVIKLAGPLSPAMAAARAEWTMQAQGRDIKVHEEDTSFDPESF